MAPLARGRGAGVPVILISLTPDSDSLHGGYSYSSPTGLRLQKTQNGFNLNNRGW
jgi:hypothetical protein